jgi:hypothetical protein
MEVGFLLELTYGAALPTRWITGAPEKRWIGGVKTDKQWYGVETWRCKSCGYLESYAPPKTRMNQITD